jgi:hypothetical protein
VRRWHNSQEKQRFCTGDDNVIHTHGDQINANFFMLPKSDGEFEFGSNAICAGNQDGLLILVDR